MSLALEEQALARYERMAAASRRMRTAAVASDWDQVLEAEAECSRIAEEMRASADSGPVSPEGRSRRINLLRRMLDDDAIVRARAQPWLATLEQFLGSRGMHRRLQDTYG